MPITIRGSRITFFNAVSVDFTLPAGSAAGDTCVIFASQINQASILSDKWDLLDSRFATNTGGSSAVWYRQLDAVDISLGFVTIYFATASAGIVGGVTFVGNVMLRSAGQYNRIAASASTTLTEATATNGDYVLYYGENRGNPANNVTSSRGASLQASSNTNASASIYGELLGATGSITNTYSFSGTPGAGYVALVIVKADPGTTQVKANQTARMVMVSGDGTARFHGAVRQVLVSNADNPLRLNQFRRMVLLKPAVTFPITYFYQAARQVLLSNTGKISMNQVVRMVLCGTTALSTLNNDSSSIIW